MQRNVITNLEQLTATVAARRTIINAVAIADIEPTRRTIAPDRVLDEARKGFGEGFVKGARINRIGTV